MEVKIKKEEDWKIYFWTNFYWKGILVDFLILKENIIKVQIVIKVNSAVRNSKKVVNCKDLIVIENNNYNKDIHLNKIKEDF